MKRKIVFKLFVCILVVISMSQTSQYVFAHSSSQEDILAKSYNSFNGGYYIGGDNVGWSIDEGIHTNGTTVTYSFDYLDQYLTDTYRMYVTMGANYWSGTVTITNKTDGSGKVPPIVKTRFSDLSE